ncbi:MAG TPA: bifunctional transaldolase/phosoglucose isomerase [Candidatus Eremiobacteraceae bacterium]|nr:bifunctional transaldolase/phosoglucose isomerase [Candidatus Eremiobacteraceae bacterium]
MPNPLQRLIDFGQSFWLDNVRRGFTRSGELRHLIDDDGLRGETSNPTIFEKAIADSSDYDDQIKSLVAEGASPPAIYDALTTTDIREACDAFRDLYDTSSGGDGYVSIELPPQLAKDTDASIVEAHRLWKLVARPNVMVKVPATPEGMPVIRRLIGDGINVNITLMFGAEYYERVIDAFMAGLEDRLAKGQPLHNIASVASCFVSRIDTEADKRIDAAMKDADALTKARLEAHLGSTAIANSKRLYSVYQRSIKGERWRTLAAAGARRQRPLWASTSTKNPKYKDTYYVEALIGPDTVDTMPPATIDAFRDHGIVKPTLEHGIDKAEETLAELEELGISLKSITDKLLADGLVSFQASYDQLLAVLGQKAQAIQGASDRLTTSGVDPAELADALARLEDERFVARFWQRDPDLWKKGDPEHAAIVKDRLGWLNSPDLMYHRTEELDSFAEGLRKDGITSVVVMGMGGSSLCPTVLRETFGTRKGYPRLLVLDSTLPESVRAIEAAIDVKATVFIESSKSGTTLEPRVFSEYFFEKVAAALGSREKAAARFACITDPGTPLETLARERGFRQIFLNPEDIGGRYSALTYFGLVPAAAAGVDVAGLLDRARGMVQACASGVKASEHPAVRLGAALATLALKHGRDKVTVLASPGITSFGLWLEQLIAESLGKEGRGLIPVAGEPPGDPGAYGADRVFVHLRLGDDRSLDARGDALQRAGHPVIQVSMRDALDLGAEFFRWEFATATVGAFLGVDAFDQPNVQESKDNTNRILTQGDAAPAKADAIAPDDEAALSRFVRSARDGDYIALLAYLHETSARDDAFGDIRAMLRDSTKAATTFGYGPRYLHSTGQLHKGGPNTGVFVELVCRSKERVPIPGRPFDFATLAAAQALGDLQSLRDHGRRVLRVDLGDDVDGSLATLRRSISKVANSLAPTAPGSKA